MTLKISPFVATVLVFSIILLAILVFRGCRQGKLDVAAKEKAQQIADSAIKTLSEYKILSDSSAKEFKDTLDLERGQMALVVNQKERTEAELDKILLENVKLTEKHKLAQYTDTTATIVPAEYLQDCESCFTKLENTTNLSLRYRGDLNALQDKQDKQNQLYQNRFKQLEQEKLGFFNKINSLAKEGKEAADKLKPHGKLYLSWGVLWSRWPIAGGAGLMYQTKYSFQYGAKVYYSDRGTIVETSMHFPLSIKF